MTRDDQERVAARMLSQADALAADGRMSESIEILEQALGRWPFLADTWFNLGLRRRRLGRSHDALDAYQRALEYGAQSPEEIHLNRGVILAEDLMRFAEAEREYRAALKHVPNYVPALLNLANLREDEGQRDAARALYQQILEINPTHREALARLANCSVIESRRDPLIERLRRSLTSSGISQIERASLSFALGRALDGVGEYGEAWEVYAAANKASKASAPIGAAIYDRSAHERLIDQIIEICDESFFSRIHSVDRASPMTNPDLVLICGMFRSGSTLVEQLLAGHPLVTAGGELDWLPSIVRDDLAPFPASLKSVDRERVATLSERYLTRRKVTFPYTRILTDKRPDNFLYLGLAHALFPSARFVVTRRHPLDNCLSVWFLHLDHRMSFGTDLLDIGHYYLQQERLMSHWRQVLGTSLCSIDYDSLTRDPESALRPLLKHCGLDWNDRCLDPRNSSGRASTASVWQVRQPLYRSSSGRWKNYARQLEPLRQMLLSAGLRFDD